LLWELRGESGGIPHLAKNERDVGHPALVAGLESKNALLASSTCQMRDLRHPLIFWRL
jgi:hypothetical protein